MKRNKKVKIDTTRVSVTLPVLMMNDFKLKADLAGISLSRIIYLQLRSKTPISIVSNRLVKEAGCLRKAMEQVAATGGLNPEALECLWKEVQYYEAWIPADKGGNVYVP
jgi:DNA primase catalytic subunit